jgi:uncharacterized protein (TIGR03067 family)
MSLKNASSGWCVLMVFLMVGCDPRTTSTPSQGTEAVAKTDQDKYAVQGEWAVVAGESRSGSGEITGETITIAGDSFTHWCGSIKFSATFSVDSAKSPKQIDFKNAIGTVDPGTIRGSVEHRSLRGIYEIAGNHIRLCVDESAMGRPSGFDGYGPNVMLILKRK